MPMMRGVPRQWCGLVGWVLLCSTPGACSRAVLPLLTPPPLVEQARQLTRSGKAEEAFRALRTRIAAPGRDLAWHRAWVEAAARSGHLEAVEAHYQGQLEEPATAALGHYGLGLAAATRGAPYLSSALQELALARQISPKEPDIPYRLGLLHLQNGTVNKAREAFASALALDPQRPAYQVAHAHSLYLSGEEDEALNGLRALWGNDPSEEDAIRAAQIADKYYSPLRHAPEAFADDLRNALRWLQKDAVQPALDAMERIIAQSPGLAVAHTIKGLAHSRLDNRAEAIVALEQSLALSPQIPIALVALGDIYSRMGRNTEARGDYQKALEYNPFCADAYARLASLARQEQDQEKAALYYGRLSKLSPQDPEIRQSYSRALIANGQWQRAFPVIESGLNRTPQDFHGWLELGKLYLLRGSRVPDERKISRQKAKACFEKARDLDRENPTIAELIKQMED